MKKEKIEEIEEQAITVFAKPVYNEDTGKLVKITPDMQEEAWQRYERLKDLTFEAAKELHLIRERELYLALGFNSFKDFYQSAGIPKRTALKDANLGQKLLGADEQVPTSAPLDDLGKSKMIELARLSQEQFNALLSGDDINGYSLADAKSQTSREVSKTITTILSGKDKNTISRLKTDFELIKAEKKVLEQQIKENSKLIKRARELEAKYDSQDKGVENRIKILEEAYSALNSFLRIANKIQIEPADTPAIAGAAASLLKTFKVAWEGIDGNGLETKLENIIGEHQE